MPFTVSSQALFKLCEKHVPHGEFDWCNEYGEPGYSSPENGSIVFANWNDVPKWLAHGLESRGYELEWSDEWYVEHNSSKAYRTSPDSYGWKPSVIFTDHGSITIDDIKEETNIDEYIDYLLNNARHCDTFGLDLAKHGFTKYNADSFESGFHPGQNDRPEDVLKKIRRESNYTLDVVFQMDSTGQFDSYWSAWTRSNKEQDNDECVI